MEWGRERKHKKERRALGIFWGLFFLSLSFSELFYNSGSCGKLIAMSVILVRGNANYAQCNAIDYCSLAFFFFFFLPVLYLFVNSVQIPGDLYICLLFAFSFEMIKTSYWLPYYLMS